MAGVRVGARGAAGVALALALALAACSGGGDGGEEAAEDTPAGSQAATTTTINTGGIEVPAPEGWTAVPVPDLGMGLAVPPGWEVTLLSPDGLNSLARSSPAVPDFQNLAHAAASAGGLLYAAGQDAAGGISDVVVRATPQAGVSTTDQLATAAQLIAANAGTDPATVQMVDGTEYPTALVPFTVGGGAPGSEGSAAATNVMVAGPRDILWEITVTSDDAASHDQLVEAIRETLTFSSGT
jgi:hypothetical protein